MKNFLTITRTKYFKDIARLVPIFDGQFIILTHILEDRAEWLDAISSIAPIILIVAIPYSVHLPSFNKLKKDYKIVTPSLMQLCDAQYLKNLIADHLSTSSPTIVLEIGGYFAKVLQNFNSTLTDKLIGIVEDTESGHRKYEQIANELHYPVVSIARSSLKSNEDFLVGASCLYSAEKLFREAGFLMDSKTALVLGFGKVGRGVAHALAKRHYHVMVYDVRPDCRLNALSEGFQIPDRNIALQKADIIYGATGDCSLARKDFTKLRNGVILISCGSKDVEFDIQALEKHYIKTSIFKNLDCYKNKSKTIYLTAHGTPINFIDGATIGPVLALTQAEIILAIKEVILLHSAGKTGVFTTNRMTKNLLTAKWLKYFLDPVYGSYLHV